MVKAVDGHGRSERPSRVARDASIGRLYARVSIGRALRKPRHLSTRSGFASLRQQHFDCPLHCRPIDAFLSSSETFFVFLDGIHINLKLGFSLS